MAILEQLGTFGFVRLLGKSGTLFAGKSWLPKTRIFARKKKKYNCLVCFCILVVVGEEIFKSPIKGLI